MKNRTENISVRYRPQHLTKSPNGSLFYSAVNGSNAILRARLIATVTWR